MASKARDKSPGKKKQQQDADSKVGIGSDVPEPATGATERAKLDAKSVRELRERTEGIDSSICRDKRGLLIVFIALLVGIFIGIFICSKWRDYVCNPKFMSLVRRGDETQSLSDIQTLLLKYDERCSCIEVEWWLWIPVGLTTPLYAAVESGSAAIVNAAWSGPAHRTAIVKELLKHKPSLNDGRWGWGSRETPLYAAARQGHVSAVKALLENSTVNINKGLEEWLYPCKLLYLGMYRTETPLYAGN
jgi:hypothetical protein